MAKPRFAWYSSTDSPIFTRQKNTSCSGFPFFFRYQFVHRFFMSYCIDVGTLLAPFGHQISCFWAIAFRGFVGWCFYRLFTKKGSGKTTGGAPFFVTFSSLLRWGCFGVSLGSLLDPFWIPLAPFWLSFGSLWLTFGYLLLHFGSLLVPLGILLLALFF